MHDLLIRAATAQDVPAIAALIVPIQRQEFGIDITYDQQPDLVDIAGFYRQGAGEFWVAQRPGDRAVAGTIALKDVGNRQGALRKMFVHPDYRGAPHFLARRLLDCLIDHARQKSLTDIYLGTTAKFLAAHRFYEKNGFSLISENALPSSFPRMSVDTRFYMRKTA